MRLKELRKFVKQTESFSDDTSVYFDFCGYTSDNESISEIKIITQDEFEDDYSIELHIAGEAYETEDDSPTPIAYWFDHDLLVYRAAYEQGHEETAIKCALNVSGEGKRRSNEEAAAILGISLRTLHRKCRDYNIGE